MAVNKGVAPFDPDTDVGQFRAMVGDVQYEELDPPETGYGDYEMFSDSEITAFLVGTDYPEEAAAKAFLQLASTAALEAKVVKDHDLQIDLTKRASALRAVAGDWQARADKAGQDIFELFPVIAPDRTRAEGTIRWF